MGLRSRNKGKRGEREAAAEIKRIFRTEASRGRQFAGFRGVAVVDRQARAAPVEAGRRDRPGRAPRAEEHHGSACDRAPRPLLKRREEALAIGGVAGPARRGGDERVHRRGAPGFGR